MKELTSWIGCLIAIGMLGSFAGCSSGSDCSPTNQQDYQYCVDSILYWVDDCGDFSSVAETCACGCRDHLTCETDCNCECGSRVCGDDGCGNSCGQCPQGLVCNAAGQCVQDCVPKTCQEAGYQCGDWTNADGCGGDLSCGSCPVGSTCNASGICEATGCPGNLEECDGICVDTRDDARHCGECSNTCSAGQVCENSSCQEHGNCNVEPCTGFSYCDLASGQCMPGCLSDDQCVGTNETCNSSTHDCECISGYHLCFGVCASNHSILSCGGRCTPCPDPSHGEPTCDGLNCGVTCDSGYHACGEQCLSNTSVDSCGTRCTPCPEPSAHGHAVCVAGSCDIQCDLGYHLCQGECVANDSIEHCGSSCVPCPGTQHGHATCDGTVCGLACDAEYHVCGTSCVSNFSVDHCGNSCTACPVPADGQATCDGTSCGAMCNPSTYLDGGNCTQGPVTIDDSGVYRWPVIAMDDDGFAHVAYCSYDKVVYARWTGGEWEKTTLAASPFYVSLAVDSNKVAHLIFRDQDADSLKYARKIAGGFDVQDLGDYWMNEESLAVDSAGRPHMAVEDKNASVLTYLRWTGSSWASSTIASLAQNAIAISLQISSLNGSVHVAFIDGEVWDNLWPIKVATLNGSSFDVVTTSNYSTEYLSMTLDGSTPHTSYATSYLTYAWQDGGAWTSHEIESSSIRDNNIVMDSGGVLHISYYSNGQSILKYATNRSGWATEVLVSTGTAGYSNDIALDLFDRPHIVYTTDSDTIDILVVGD